MCVFVVVYIYLPLAVLFCQVVGLILSHFKAEDPLPTKPCSPSPRRVFRAPSQRMMSKEESVNPCPSIPSLLTSFPVVPPRYKCLFKIVKCINSVHFKVVLQAIGIMLSDMVLTMVVSTPAHYSDNDDNDGDDGSSRCSNLDDHKGRLLNSLVEALIRRNRTHWNVAVREASEVGLDRLLDIIM
jgi:hypothetical protein